MITAQSDLSDMHGLISLVPCHIQQESDPAHSESHPLLTLAIFFIAGLLSTMADPC